MINNKDPELIKRNHKLVLGPAVPVLIVLGLTIIFLYLQMEPYGRLEDWNRVRSWELEDELGQLVWILIGAFGLIWSVVAITLGAIAMAIAGNRPRRIAAIGLILGLAGALINLVVSIRLLS